MNSHQLSSDQIDALLELTLPNVRKADAFPRPDINDASCSTETEATQQHSILVEGRRAQEHRERKAEAKPGPSYPIRPIARPHPFLVKAQPDALAYVQAKVKEMEKTFAKSQAASWKSFKSDHWAEIERIFRARVKNLAESHGVNPEDVKLNLVGFAKSQADAQAQYEAILAESPESPQTEASTKAPALVELRPPLSTENPEFRDSLAAINARDSARLRANPKDSQRIQMERILNFLAEVSKYGSDPRATEKAIIALAKSQRQPQVQATFEKQSETPTPAQAWTQAQTFTQSTAQAQAPQADANLQSLADVYFYHPSQAKPEQQSKTPTQAATVNGIKYPAQNALAHLTETIPRAREQANGQEGNRISNPIEEYRLRRSQLGNQAKQINLAQAQARSLMETQRPLQAQTSTQAPDNLPPQTKTQIQSNPEKQTEDPPRAQSLACGVLPTQLQTQDHSQIKEELEKKAQEVVQKIALQFKTQQQSQTKVGKEKSIRELTSPSTQRLQFMKMLAQAEAQSRAFRHLDTEPLTRKETKDADSLRKELAKAKASHRKETSALKDSLQQAQEENSVLKLRLSDEQTIARNLRSSLMESEKKYKQLVAETKAKEDVERRREEEKKAELPKKTVAFNISKALSQAEEDVQAQLDAQEKVKAKAEAEETAKLEAKAQIYARAYVKAEAEARAEVRAKARAEAEARAKAQSGPSNWAPSYFESFNQPQPFTRAKAAVEAQAAQAVSWAQAYSLAQMMPRAPTQAYPLCWPQAYSTAQKLPSTQGSNQAQTQVQKLHSFIDRLIESYHNSSQKYLEEIRCRDCDIQQLTEETDNKIEDLKKELAEKEDKISELQKELWKVIDEREEARMDADNMSKRLCNNW